MLNTIRIIYLMRAIPKRCFAYAEKYYKENGLDNTKTYILLLIEKLGGECSFNKIIQTTLFSPSTVSKQLKKLEEKGFVEITSDELKPRHKRVKTTNKSHEYTEKTFELLKERERIGTRGLKEKQKVEFKNYLEIFFNNINYKQITLPETNSRLPMIIVYLAAIERIIQSEMYLKQGNGLISEPEEHLLLALAYDPIPCSFKKLERITVISQPHLVRSIKNLEKSGWVATEIDAKDNRVKKAIITESGMLIAKQLEEDYTLQEEKGCNGLTTIQQEQLQHFLLIFERNLIIEFGNFY